MKRNQKGFTLIELLVVISIIGLLSSIVLSSLNTARAKARDARRKSDIHSIVTSLYLYREIKGDWVEMGSGCGQNGDGTGNGNGWFSYSLPDGDRWGYKKSIAQCLVDAGASSAIIRDPSGYDQSSYSDNRYTYMKYTCSIGGKKHTFVYTKLETVPVSPTATDGTCNSGIDSAYGMNYYQEIVE